ncbi:helix-turn-helix domain-containing protein [Tumebacillus sp. ITR2]|uniref:Helix-turn-helix domain-containing protein n=1 Tax=Tumebacillus amylolyticus TaxID=2801339 RepID=A0ABS1J722_9BACL|nr:helix-turn-helix domain-containing protein [Tumebacillus amylolyticus]MBL0386063.1 helix-turn-helix domain-containing protein [Tumebacillus amylolyticus]
MAIDDKDRVGEKVRSYREARGWSQKELAEKAELSPSTISKVEGDVFTPTPDTIQRIADALGVKLSELIDIGASAELEAVVQIELMKIFVERKEYQDALGVIDHLNKRTDLAEHQRIDLTLAHADCLIQTGKNRAAIDLLQDLRQVLETKRTDEYILATVLNKLGTAYFTELSIADAYAHYIRAHQITKSFPVVDELTAKVAFNMGQVYSWMRNPVDAQFFLQIAEKYFRDISDHKKLADTLFANGLVFQELNQLDRAERYLREALALYCSQNFLVLAQRVKYQLASRVTSKMEPEVGIQELNECAKMFQQFDDMPRFIYTHATIAEIHLEVDNLELAGEHLQTAFEAFPSEDYATSTNNAYLFRVNAKCLLRTGAYEKSLEYSFKSSGFYSKMGVQREAADSLEIAVHAYELLGDKDKALELGKQVRDMLRDSLDKSFFKEGV